MLDLQIKNQYEWNTNLNSIEWDKLLTTLNGHPLQSAQWGDSRKIADNIEDSRWAAFKNGKPVFLVRFEKRLFLKFIKIAWVPKGPTILDQDCEVEIREEFLSRLKREKYLVCVFNPWKKILESEGNSKKSVTQTVWVNLNLGTEKLKQNLSKHFRNDILRAKKKGVLVEKVKDETNVKLFYELCQSVSHAKNFDLNTSELLMLNLLHREGLDSQLFVAYFEEKLCGGAFVIRSGESVHYMWGATDRNFSKLSIGEVLQWEVIEWAVSQKCHKYDLEGIDFKNNPGTYNFKKKLAGEIITLPGKQIYILNKFVRSLLKYSKILKWLNLFYARLKYEFVT